MSENGAGKPASKRRGKPMLSPSQEYEIWLQLLRREVTIAEAAAAQQAWISA